ncbi:ComEC/Rec2 family competence protein [Sphingobacterium daejeonense]|uniref:ComEC/Rec2 family competence protein n=1 Tax=Sphingobacterium daejeonense TaxID=371142 RepID=A0ABW3RPN2_9SPHI
MKIKFLQAFNGDSIWISFLENDIPRNILIDGGTSTTYTFKDKKDGKIKQGDLKNLIEFLKANNEKLDLVILTHIDDDHIDGFLKWFSKDETAIQNIKEIWFNSGRIIKKYLNDTKAEINPVRFKEQTTLTSVSQGVDFENYIREKEVWDEKVIKQGDIIDWNGIAFQILSPSKEKLVELLKEWEKKAPASLLDTSRKDDYKKTLKKVMKENTFEEDDDPYNGSSISFIITREDKKYLFLADSHPSNIISELKRLGYNPTNNKLQIEILKISHHGSQKNTSVELLELIETYKYVISTNGDMHGHPDKATIARIVNANSKAKIYFNYPTLIDKLILKEDRTDYPNVEFLGTESL